MGKDSATKNLGYTYPYAATIHPVRFTPNGEYLIEQGGVKRKPKMDFLQSHQIWETAFRGAEIHKKRQEKTRLMMQKIKAMV